MPHEDHLRLLPWGTVLRGKLKHIPCYWRLIDAVSNCIVSITMTNFDIQIDWLIQVNNERCTQAHASICSDVASPPKKGRCHCHHWSSPYTTESNSLSLSLSLIPASTPQQANNGIYYMCYDAYTLHATILLHGHGRAFLNNARYSKHWNLSHIGWAKMILNTNRS